MKRAVIVSAVVVSSLLAASCGTFVTSGYRQTPSLAPKFPPGPVRSIGSVAEVENLGPLKLTGYGVVTGVRPRSRTDQTQDIRYGVWNTTSVVVTAVLPPFQKEGTTVDVTVRAAEGEEILEGGKLVLTVLRATPPGCDYLVNRQIMYATAEGRVIPPSEETAEVDEQSRIRDGARIQLRYVPRIFQTAPDGRRFLRLLLKRPDEDLARRISDRLNMLLFRTYDRQGRRFALTVARVLGPDSVGVYLPEKEAWESVMRGPYPSFEQDPMAFVKKVLRMRVSASALR